MLENFVMITQQVLVLFVLIGIGFVCGKRGILTDAASKKLTDIVLYVVTPCVMISAFQRDFSVELLENILITALCATLIIFVTIGLSALIIHDKAESRQKVLRFASIFSNCGFMSLPLQKALLGDDGWFYGSIFVAFFNLIMWSYGLVMMSGDKKQLSAKKIIFNPGIVGVVFAFILFICRIKLPYIIAEPVSYLSNLNTPVPMLIIGFYLSQADFKSAFTDFGAYISMGIRLVLIPVISIFAMHLFKVDTTIMITCIIASSAPAAATTTMFATKFNRDIELSVSLVSASTLLSIATMPIMVALAQSISA
ncbi:MAG: AEC family transporter [Ruminococcus sp.]|nr:AEC family transporter [Ruminococcus sp.]